MYLTIMCTMDRRLFSSWFDVNQSTFDDHMREKRFLYFRSQWPFDIFTPSFTSVRDNFREKYILSTTIQYWVNERYVRYVTDRQTDRQTENSAKAKHFRWCNVSDDIYKMIRGSFWFWFYTNRSSFDQDMREKNFSFPVTLIFELRTLNLLPWLNTYIHTCSLFQTQQVHRSKKAIQKHSYRALCLHYTLEVPTSFLFRENRRNGMDGQANRPTGATFNAAS